MLKSRNSATDAVYQIWINVNRRQASESSLWGHVQLLIPSYIWCGDMTCITGATHYVEFERSL